MRPLFLRVNSRRSSGAVVLRTDLAGVLSATNATSAVGHVGGLAKLKFGTACLLPWVDLEHPSQAGGAIMPDGLQDTPNMCATHTQTRG